MATTSTARPTVTVIGLRFGQAALIEARCRDAAHLKFVNADQSKIVFPISDHVFLLTRFLGHRWDTAAVRHLPRSRVHRHGGGLSSLARRIRALAHPRK
jgi:hypothetical protein